MSLPTKATQQVQQKADPPTPSSAPTAPPRPARSPTAMRPGKARLTDDHEGLVEFQFSPELIKIGHQPDTVPMNRTMGKEVKSTDKPATVVNQSNDVIVDAGEASISFSDIMLDGSNVIKDCAQLLKWTYPVKDPKNEGPELDMTILHFTWDKFETGLKFIDPLGRASLILAKVDISYTRFDHEGKAVRAKVNLNCKIPPSTLSGTNPTSGGRPARTGHLVTAGEDLPGIARSKYGNPGHWRRLAELNGIDDPLRVRPGDRLFVPGRAELTGGAT